MSNKNIFSSIFMVAGCAMGAGCLAMPFVAAPVGLLTSIIFLCLTALFSYILSSVSLEIFLLYKNDFNISSIAHKSFGKFGVLFAGFINIALMYALLCVYMTGVSDLINKTILPFFHIYINENLSLILFMLIILPMFFKGAHLVMSANKFIFIIKFLSFISILLFGIKFISPGLLFHTTLSQIIYLPVAIPILVGAFWFHFIIPVIAKINNYDRKLCNKIFAYGIIIPLILYILWVAFILSMIPLYGSGNTFSKLLHNKESVGTMINYASYNNPSLSNIIKILLNLFSNVAMMTSFLTVGIATYDYLRDALKIKQTTRGVFDNLLITMLPPFCFALFFPGGFIIILKQATILLLLINTFMLLCCLKQYDNLHKKPKKSLIYALLFIIVVVIIIQLLDNFSLLPTLS